MASLESRRDYQIIYANGFGLPDPSLTETSATGIVWFFPLASEPDYHVLLPTYTSADGRVAVGQGFINHSAMSVIPYVFPHLRPRLAEETQLERVSGVWRLATILGIRLGIAHLNCPVMLRYNRVANSQVHAGSFFANR